MLTNYVRTNISSYIDERDELFFAERGQEELFHCLEKASGQEDFALLLNNKIMIACSSENKTHLSRTFFIAEQYYEQLGKDVFLNNPPQEFRWQIWKKHQEQRLKAKKTKSVACFFDQGVSMLLLKNEEYIPNLIKGTINTMMQDENIHHQMGWDHCFGFKIPDSFFASKFRTPEELNAAHKWNSNAEKVVLQRIVDETSIDVSHPVVKRKI